jgi:hypothetical protein
MSYPVSAEYIFRPRQSTELLWGTFVLRDSEGKQLCAVVATSGATGFQNHTHYKTKGKGLLPPYSEYTISTEGYFLATKGIEGMFYPILPSPVPGYGRSELGLHDDANVPGSAGCIVIENRATFRNTVVPLLSATLKQGIREIPLKITYQR